LNHYNEKGSKIVSKGVSEYTRITTTAPHSTLKNIESLEDFLSSNDSYNSESEENLDSKSINMDAQDDERLQDFLRNNDDSNTDPATTIPPTIPNPTNPSIIK
jgi:hypothetical protein